MGGTLEENEQLLKFSNQVFIGQPYLKMLTSLCLGVIGAKGLEISPVDMKCP